MRESTRIYRIVNSRAFYPMLFSISLVINFVMVKYMGVNVSHDFKAVYSPNAVAIAEWMKGLTDFSDLIGSEYYITHIVYIIFVGIIYFLFDVGSVINVILAQIIISSFLLCIIFYVCAKEYKYISFAIIFCFLSMFNFDSLQWTYYASPEALYRFLFIGFYCIIVKLFFDEEFLKFLLFSIVSFVILFFSRGDTLVLFFPVYILQFIAIKKLVRKKGLSFLIGGVLGLAGFLIIFNKELIHLADIVIDLFYFHYNRGDIVGDVDQVVKGMTTIGRVSGEHGISYHVARSLKLFFLRVFHFVNIFPPFWSEFHRLYYAFFIVPVYFGAICGIFKSFKTKKLDFFMFFAVYLSSILLHGLTRVDASHRTALTAMTCLIMFSGYGYDYLYGHIRKYFSSDKRSVEETL